MSELTAVSGAPVLRVSLSLDFGSRYAILSTADLGLDSLPMDDTGADGLSIPVPAYIVFEDSERGPVGYASMIRVRPGPVATSSIGSDLLREWFVAIDLRDSLVVIQPHDPDEAGSGSI